MRIFFYLFITSSSFFYLSSAKADTLPNEPLVSDVGSDSQSQQKPGKEQPPKKIIPPVTDLSEQSSPVAPSEVNPLSTLIPINGIETNHQSDYGIGASLTLGDSQSTNIGLNAIKLFSPRIEERISNQGIYRTEYNNNYVQIGARTQQKDISINFDRPAFLEDSSISPFLGVGRIRQVLVSNGQQSGISRTMRGFNYFGSTELAM
jgi:hypothetical protein